MEENIKSSTIQSYEKIVYKKDTAKIDSDLQCNLLLILDKLECSSLTLQAITETENFALLYSFQDFYNSILKEFKDTVENI